MVSFRKKNNPPNNMPNYMPSDTQNGGILCSVVSSIRKDFKLPKIPKRTLYRITKELKDRGVIEKSGYGTWKIINEKKASKILQDEKETICHDLLATVQRRSPVTDKRGHKFIAIMVVSSLDLKSVKKQLEYKGRGSAVWVDGGRAGKYLQYWLAGACWNIYEHKVVCRLNKSFFAEHHIQTQDSAVAHFKAISATFSDNMGSCFKPLTISYFGEFEKVGSDFAKWCDCSVSFKVGNFWYKQDKSGGTANEEGNDAEIMDMLEKSPDATPEGMQHVVNHFKETGRLWHKDIEDYMVTQAKLITQKLRLDYEQQKSLNISSTIEDKKKHHKDLPSYFG